jgi:galactokinase (EC 2.7.1.6)
LREKKGAYGAKLTGAGGGGSIIALVDESRLEKVKSSLEKRVKNYLLHRLQKME